MPRIRGNGGVIGVANPASGSGAPGLYTTSEIGLYRIQNLWPSLKGAQAFATGGTVTLSNGVGVYHTFISSGSFIPSQALNGCTVLIVGGGSGGGLNNFPGCGGSGGFVTYYTGVNFSNGATYTITVGLGGTAQAVGYAAGGNGGTSSIVGTGVNLSASGGTTTGASFTTASGSNNNGSILSFSGSNGQGGAGAGANAGATAGGIGSTLGDTLTKAIFSAGGTVYGDLQGGSYYYGGGGGSGNGGQGAFGGGGNGTGFAGGVLAGTPNTGGGGGGGSQTNGTARDGGKGIVLIFYPY